ncbi:ATP-binding cassette sub-family F member 3-like [Mytilus californianus]|uniref:ATP-binding cassette sub-family F member 3-like n=1 Tax=Mytilus californianus TaxID=6549 RepID=UPI0022479352|nr:ATP-binding cassette sub-family F member 3-like [Mytilus californianus]
MADYEGVLTQCIPTIDDEIVTYVNSILEDSHDDFDDSDALFEAIGDVLMQTDDSKSEDEIRQICKDLHDILIGSKTGTTNNITNGTRRMLNAPLQMSEMVKKEHDERSVTSSNIWLTKKDLGSAVDQKKLEKAEQQIQKKITRKTETKTTKKPAEKEEEMASASQQFNRKDTKFDASGQNRSLDIKIDDFDISFGEKQLIKGASIQLLSGRRYGFVGRNGLGKTTLLKLLSRGHLKIPSHISILHVEQEVVGDQTIALDSVLECDEERNRLLKEEKEINAQLSSSPTKTDAGISTRLSEIYQQLEAMEADKAPAKAAVILAGLGFTPKMQGQTTKEFSGGWRMRLALARALFTKPDLLLLDEPTNMLDMKAIIWLENYLQKWQTTMLVVSHDRMFLNAISTDILYLNNQLIETYRGNYDIFHKTREQRLINQQKEYEAQVQYREHLQVFIDRFRYNANRASSVQSKLKILEKLPPLIAVEKVSTVTFRFPECERLSPPILQLDEVGFYYSRDQVIFNSICVNADMESRICIVGENGAGKTTLLKILQGDLSPTSGICHTHRNLSIGYFSQHHVDQLEMDQTSLEMMAEKFPGNNSELYRNKLGQFGVSGDLALRPVSSLSGGQKSRVAFAVLCMQNPNFLILDEPTNHLDMETIDALGNALLKFKGGVILVSHDERLIRMICKELWVVQGGTVRTLEGGFEEYKHIVEKELDMNC